MAEREKLIELKDLQISFGTGRKKFVAVDHVNFDIYKGETFSLVGESGSGKTTIGRAILRINPTSAGDIYFKGQKINGKISKELDTEVIRKCQMIFQDPMASLNERAKVDYIVSEGLINFHLYKDEKEREEKVQKVLREVGLLPEFASRFPHEFSGGMRQRVMIAMALACNPKILIADEPTTALDVTIQAQIMDLMRELKEKMNTAIILVTHDLGVVANFADRIQVMYAGQVVERGTAREIFYDSKHPYTWALLSSVPKLAKESKQELYALKGTPPDLILPLNCCPFASRCEYCMPICKERNPFETTITDTHKVSCWLQHPNAPKVKSFYDREAK